MLPCSILMCSAVLLAVYNGTLYNALVDGTRTILCLLSCYGLVSLLSLFLGGLGRISEAVPRSHVNSGSFGVTWFQCAP